MSKFEFHSTETYTDHYAAKRSIIITGANQSISCEQITSKVQKLYDYRFGQNELVSCNAFHKT